MQSSFVFLLDDIEGTRYTIRDRMLRTERHVDPLMPQYKLPGFVCAEPYQPKFIHDNIDYSDVKGSQPRIRKLPAPKDKLSVDDIEGARADFSYLTKWSKISTREVLKAADDASNMKFQTHRVSDVLDPAYYIHGMKVEDEKRYSKPKNLKGFIADNHLLQTRDIPVRI